MPTSLLGERPPGRLLDPSDQRLDVAALVQIDLDERPGKRERGPATRLEVGANLVDVLRLVPVPRMAVIRRGSFGEPREQRLDGPGAVHLYKPGILPLRKSPQRARIVPGVEVAFEDEGQPRRELRGGQTQEGRERRSVKGRLQLIPRAQVLIEDFLNVSLLRKATPRRLASSSATDVLPLAGGPVTTTSSGRHRYP